MENMFQCGKCGKLKPLCGVVWRETAQSYVLACKPSCKPRDRTQ